MNNLALPTSNKKRRTSFGVLRSPERATHRTIDDAPAVYPTGWDNQDKMAMMFGELPPKTSPAFPERLQFWTDAIELFLSWHNRLGADIKTLTRYFTNSRDGMKPLGLDAVVAVLIERGDMCTASSYVERFNGKSISASSSRSWGVKSALSTVGGWLGFGKHSAQSISLPAEPFISVAQIAHAEQAIMTAAEHLHASRDQSMANCFVSEENLMKEANLQLSESDQQLTLNSLMAQGKLAFLHKSEHGIRMFKFARNGAKVQIGPTDADLCKLQLSREVIEAHHEDLMRRHQSVSEQLSQAIHAHRRDEARFHLLQKKNLEARLENIRASLLNIEALTNKIEQASVNGVGLQALKSGKDVLQVVNRNADIDQIEDVMDDIRDLVDEVAEADERVAAAVVPLSVSEESELAAELQQLEHDIGIEELLQTMPEVPSSRPMPGRAEVLDASEPAAQTSQRSIVAEPAAL